MKKILTTLALGLTILASNTLKAEEKVCLDDPRLYTIGNVMNSIKAGEETLPLKLRAQTFLALTPEVRAILGDNILVFDANCTPYQVYNGKPPVKIEMPFELLTTYFKEALSRGDVISARASYQFFRAAPVSIHEAVGFTTKLNLSELEKKTLDALAVAPNVGYSYLTSTGSSNNPREHNSKCNSVRQPMNLLDLYALMGGRITGDKEFIIQTHGYSSTLVTKTRFIRGLEDTVFPKGNDTCWASNPQHTVGVLSALGASFKGWYTSSSIDKDWRAEFK